MALWTCLEWTTRIVILVLVCWLEVLVKLVFCYIDEVSIKWAHTRVSLLITCCFTCWEFMSQALHTVVTAESWYEAKAPSSPCSRCLRWELCYLISFCRWAVRGATADLKVPLTILNFTTTWYEVSLRKGCYAVLPLLPLPTPRESLLC